MNKTAVKADEIAERVSRVLSEEAGSGDMIEDLKRSIQTLKSYSISRLLEQKFQRMFGSEWANNEDLKAIVDEQKEFEENALKIWKTELDNLTHPIVNLAMPFE